MKLDEMQPQILRLHLPHEARQTPLRMTTPISGDSPIQETYPC
jgi:hypothetical protein